MDEIGVAAKAVTEYGVLLVLCILLIRYVYKQQMHLNLKADEREKIAYERELEHRQFIDALKNDLRLVACDNNRIVTKIDGDVDKLHVKMVGLGTDIDHMKVTVGEIKAGMGEIKTGVDHIQNTMVIRTARASEDD